MNFKGLICEGQSSKVSLGRTLLWLMTIIILIFCLIILIPELFGLYSFTYVQAAPTYYHTFSVDSTNHEEYGLTYPITYEFSIPSSSSNLEAYKRFSLSEAWIQIVEQSRNDYFNGIEAVRFDYAQNRAYISISFSDYSDTVYLVFKDSSGNEIVSSFLGISDYYDNRNQ